MSLFEAHYRLPSLLIAPQELSDCRSFRCKAEYLQDRDSKDNLCKICTFPPCLSRDFFAAARVFLSFLGIMIHLARSEDQKVHPGENFPCVRKETLLSWGKYQFLLIEESATALLRSVPILTGISRESSSVARIQPATGRIRHGRSKITEAFSSVKIF